MELNITINRGKPSVFSTPGELYIGSDNTPRFCYTLERPWSDGINRRDNKATPEINESTAILPDRYELIPHQLHWGDGILLVPMLIGTKDRDGICIHPANKPSQLLGCIAVGTMKQVNDYMGDSVTAFKALMKIIQLYWDRGEKVYLTIHNNF